jgi:predicted transcriptional regulator of viral defense system
MRFDALVKLTAGLPCFDLATLVQAGDERREAVCVQLSRWMKQGRAIGLRRGMYTLSDAYRRAAVIPAALANELYRPSYVSGLWALAHYDLIPERVVRLTSVTPRVPRRFENPFGTFDYRNIKKDSFFGVQTANIAGQPVTVAQPEKALLDHWHLVEGEWTPERLEEMRYQHMERIVPGRLLEYARRFGSPRLLRAAERWLDLADRAEEGSVSL